MALPRKMAQVRSTLPRAHAGRRERHKADIRSRLFRAALQLFASRGFTATTVEEITHAADVAKGTFFNYFPTKEHLLTALGEFRLDALRVTHAEVRDHGENTTREALRRLLLSLPAQPWESRPMARCLLSGGLGGGPVSSLAAKTMTEGRGLLRSIMELGQRRGEIRSDWRADDLAGLFQQLFFGTMYRWTLDPHLNLARCLRVTFNLFWAGVEARPEQLKVQLKKSRKRPS
jgi:AcrR family transcriptional regulator